jgi:hypothetical protein
VRGASEAISAADLNFSDIWIDYLGGSPTNECCMQFVNYFRSVKIDNLNCVHVHAGIRSFLPSRNAFDGFTVRSSYFENIATDAVQTYGSWRIFDSTFESIGGNGIVNPHGVTMVYGNTFIHIVGRDMLPIGGTFVVDPFVSPSAAAHQTAKQGAILSN